jgi:monofunctional glycosyltransferase
MRKVILFGLLLLCLVAYLVFALPDVSSLKKENPQITALMRQRESEAKAAGKNVRRYQRWVSNGAISSSLKTAVIQGAEYHLFLRTPPPVGVLLCLLRARSHGKVTI